MIELPGIVLARFFVRRCGTKLRKKAPIEAGAFFLHFSTRYTGKMDPLKTTALFVATAVAAILGCYLPHLWLNKGKSAWLLVPSALSLAVFSWLLTLHPAAAGRVYAAYGGVYISVALLWLWAVDGIRPQAADFVGVTLCIAGMAVIMFGPRG